MQNEPKPASEEQTEVEDLAIDDLEDHEVPFSWVCVTSTTCKCTSTSCAGWSF